MRKITPLRWHKGNKQKHVVPVPLAVKYQKSMVIHWPKPSVSKRVWEFDRYVNARQYVSENLTAQSMPGIRVWESDCHAIVHFYDNIVNHGSMVPSMLETKKLWCHPNYCGHLMRGFPVVQTPSCYLKNINQELRMCKQKHVQNFSLFIKSTLKKSKDILAAGCKARSDYFT